MQGIKGLKARRLRFGARGLAIIPDGDDSTARPQGFGGGKARPAQAENGHFTTSHGGDRRHQILNPAKITARRATNAPIFFTFA